MRSFAIEETPSLLPALYATLVSTITFKRQKSEYGQRQRQSNSLSHSHLEKKGIFQHQIIENDVVFLGNEYE